MITRSGHPPKLNDAQRQVIARMIESGPIPAVHGVVRWRLIDPAQWIFEELRITIAKQTLSRELRANDDGDVVGHNEACRQVPIDQEDSAQSSTPWKTSGSSCGTIGSPIASSNPTMTSSTIVVTPGTSSSISHGGSCPSDCENGHTGFNQRDLILGGSPGFSRIALQPLVEEALDEVAVAIGERRERRYTSLTGRAFDVGPGGARRGSRATRRNCRLGRRIGYRPPAMSEHGAGGTAIVGVAFGDLERDPQTAGADQCRTPREGDTTEAVCKV
jgi:hypothetical protein